LRIQAGTLAGDHKPGIHRHDKREAKPNNNAARFDKSNELGEWDWQKLLPRAYRLKAPL